LSGSFSIRGTSLAPLPVAFVGDSGYLLDPILAQGAGLAIEDAYHLSKALTTPLIVPEQLKKYEDSRLARRRRVHMISNVVQQISHREQRMRSSMDGLAIMLPHSVKSPFFDFMLQLSIKQ
jgi:2-polyprenyl-6-methoxyphenol hydroxylase-like FAD-dependent oxidoreductase